MNAIGREKEEASKARTTDRRSNYDRLLEVNEVLSFSSHNREVKLIFCYPLYLGRRPVSFDEHSQTVHLTQTYIKATLLGLQ